MTENTTISTSIYYDKDNERYIVNAQGGVRDLLESLTMFFGQIEDALDYLADLWSLNSGSAELQKRVVERKTRAY